MSGMPVRRELTTLSLRRLSLTLGLMINGALLLCRNKCGMETRWLSRSTMIQQITHGSWWESLPSDSRKETILDVNPTLLGTQDVMQLFESQSLKTNKIQVFTSSQEVVFWVDGVSQGRFSAPSFLSQQPLYFAVMTANQNSEVEIVE